MFTGIIEKTGKLERKTERSRIIRLRFRVSGIQDGMKTGDSVSCNGVCLTVVNFGADFIEVDVIQATIKSTAFGFLKKGSLVNFERSLRLGDRLGGHWVQGHVDETGQLNRKIKKGRNVVFQFACSPEIVSQLVPKGSIAINGISLTIQTMHENGFTVAMIPHTLKETNMGSLKIGDRVNLEVDILSKYAMKKMKKGSGTLL